MEKKKISFFSRGVQDTDPRETSVEQLVHLIAHDDMVKELTLKYRYFKEQGFNNDAKKDFLFICKEIQTQVKAHKQLWKKRKFLCK